MAKRNQDKINSRFNSLVELAIKKMQLVDAEFTLNPEVKKQQVIINTLTKQLNRELRQLSKLLNAEHKKNKAMLKKNRLVLNKYTSLAKAVKK